jgi:oxygen-dependent protoporphyrinogen oxidase
MCTDISITLVEKNPEAGGWIRTLNQDGFLFETGPRGCRTKGSGRATLSLVQELGLEEMLIGANSNAKHRFIWKKDGLLKFPHSLRSLLFSPLGHQLCKAFCRDLFTPGYRGHEEESVREFFYRRFGKDFTDNCVEPLILGIYAGDYGELSLKACFPQLYSLEKSYGSILMGMMRSKKSHQSRHPLKAAPLFSFKDGMQTLPKALLKRLDAKTVFNSSVSELRFSFDAAEVIISGEMVKADYVISCLPASALGELLLPHSNEIAHLLFSIPTNSVDVISFGFKESVLPLQGFGYLIPSSEKQKVLGMTWDSKIFPQQSLSPHETRLTVMMRVQENSLVESVESAKECIKKQLQIHEAPQVISSNRAAHAIPQYKKGHTDLVNRLEELVRARIPRLAFLGNSFYGVSVNDCIAKAKQVAEDFASVFNAK